MWRNKENLFSRVLTRTGKQREHGRGILKTTTATNKLLIYEVFGKK